MFYHNVADGAQSAPNVAVGPHSPLHCSPRVLHRRQKAVHVLTFPDTFGSDERHRCWSLRSRSHQPERRHATPLQIQRRHIEDDHQELVDNTDEGKFLPVTNSQLHHLFHLAQAVKDCVSTGCNNLCQANCSGK